MTQFRTRSDGTRYPVNSIYVDYTKAESYTHPMRCKQCSAYVFFYQSENGGKAVFDDLGHPWPKHQHQLGVIAGAVSKRDLGWIKAGYRPMVCDGKLAAKTGLWKTTILGTDTTIMKKRILWLPKEFREKFYETLNLKNHPMFCKLTPDSWVSELSFLREEEGIVSSMKIKALLIPEGYGRLIIDNKFNNQLNKAFNVILSRKMSEFQSMECIKERNINIKSNAGTCKNVEPKSKRKKRRKS